ncbi:MAG: DUF411 domain-containing protein [Parcubacteria group bacterium]|nr:DUF411 domain-containing protein [Parcubacteria group bacterium]
MKRVIIAVAVVAGIGGTVLLQQSFNSADSRVPGVTAPMAAVVHKTPACGCCANYITYLKRKGFEVEVQNHDDLTAIKEQYGIPGGLESCHTTVIGDYVSEGHVPVESIMSMLSEKPEIAGLALPGMPAGAPGMGGVARGELPVYGFTGNGDVSRYQE